MKNLRFKNRKSFSEAIKFIIAPEIIQLIKRKISFSKKVDEIPRYTETKVGLIGKEIIIPDNVSFNFMHKEIFEQEIYKFKTSRQEPYILDGGANIGLSTIYFKKLFPDAKIVGFEPDPNIFKILKKNIGKFNFQNIELVNKGLWNAKKELNFGQRVRMQV